ncbi:MAG TPA: chorismate mutase [Solirubrobacterales bacterium]|jgi:chorismate mutase|nr:chorismate mutase [Solirubrobacterales bacterium]
MIENDTREGSDDQPAWSEDLRLFALRGATTTTENSEDQIIEATEELVVEILKRNDLAPAALVSCIFTCTTDLDAQFPAVAARRLGLDKVPLLCATEIAVPGSLPRAIRILAHYYAPSDHEPTHVYLRDAVTLRADLSAAQ